MRSNNTTTSLKSFTGALGLIAALALPACGGMPNATSEAGLQTETSRASFLDLLEQMRPTQAEMVAMIASQRGAPLAPAAFTPGLQTAAVPPTLSAVELVPYLLDGDGNLIELTSTMEITAVADGTLVVLPYQVEYADGSTTFSGYLDIRFVWNAELNLFYQATPAYVLAAASSAEGIVVRGTIYNQFLDLLDGQTHDNGEIANATVYAVTQNQQVYAVETEADGSYVLGPLPVGVPYVIVAANDGFYPSTATLYYEVAVDVDQFDMDLFPAFTHLVQTSSLYGTVRDLDGTPTPWAFVRVLDADTGDAIDGVEATMTNANGEYIVHNVPASADIAYIVDARAGSKSVQSEPVAIDPANTPDAVMVELELPNHAPVLDCHAAGLSGNSIYAQIPVGGELEIAASATDADGDTVIITWSKPNRGSIQEEPLVANVSQAVYFAGGWSESIVLRATATDAVSKSTCEIEVQVGSN